MDYQAICAAIEIPLNAAFAALQPPVKIYFDNIIAVPPDAPGEYAMVNILFGRTMESTLSSGLDYARGAVVIRIYAKKNAGGLRARKVAEAANSALCTLASSQKPASGVFLRMRDISGPSFYMDEQQPHFMARIDASWDATNLG